MRRPWTTSARAGEAALLDDGGTFPWIGALRNRGSLRVPRRDGKKLVALLASFPRKLRVELPREIEVETVSAEPRPRVRIAAYSRGFGRDPSEGPAPP